MNQGTVEGLKRMGCQIVHVRPNGNGQLVHLIRSDRWNVAMFSGDATDLVTGRATIDEIIKRNVGADLADGPDGWFTVEGYQRRRHETEF
jgi:hypothetical protein